MHRVDRSPDAPPHGEEEDAAESSLERELTLLIRRALRRVWLESYGPEGDLDHATFPLLLVLSEEGPMRVSEMARTFRLDKSTVSRHLSRLESAGLVETRPDPTDRRCTLLHVTRRGGARVRRIRTARKAPLRRVLAGWRPEERAGLASMLERLNRDIEEELARTDV
jgi:DNA-binding MarR family transcriptional regulator